MCGLGPGRLVDDRHHRWDRGERSAGKSGGCSGDCALPAKAASPKLKTPASWPTNQYPLPSGVAAMPTMGSFSGMPPVEP